MASRHRAGVSPANRSNVNRRRATGRQGFTLVEAMVAITVLALAGSVLLLAVDTSLQTTTEAVDRSVADGLAQQLLDEISLKRFMEPGTDAGDPLGPTAWEAGSSGRERFNDTDDYHNFSAQPVEGLWGEPLGTGSDDGSARHSAFQLPTNHFDSWRQRIEVYFVDPIDHSIRLTSGTSDYRGVEVHIERVEADGSVIPLASRKKVIAYIAPPTY